MIQVRRGVFETNSSSSHSIVMMKTDKPTIISKDDWRIRDGVLHFWSQDLEFGRSPFELLSDWEGRLRYCIASYSNQPDKINDLAEICMKHIPNFVKFEFDKSEWRDNGFDMGYIDHQSIGILDDALARFNISLEDFIFNDRYVVVIDGDEYCVFDTFMDTEMFNKDAIKMIEPPISGDE